MGTFRKIMCASLAVSCAAGALSGCENFQPRAEVIQNTERWKAFFQGTTKFYESVQSMDDGSLVLVFYPTMEDPAVFLKKITDDAVAGGWTKLDSVAIQSVEHRFHLVKKRDKILRQHGATDTPRQYFTYDNLPWEPNVGEIEIVEISLVEDESAVVFVSHYASTQ
jgi:hypothetical protein